jgi:RNA polymerase sigma-70 factor, ECF subfamily
VVALSASDAFLDAVPPFDADALRQHRDWVARMAAGEADGLTHLHEVYAPLLHGIARRILGDPDETRDVVQETFVKAWQQAGSYRPERGEVFAWLVFMARNQAIDRRRRRSRRDTTHAEFAEEAAALGDAAAAPVEPGTREVLERTLAQLSAEQRRALELAFFRGWTQGEIAAAMRTPLGNVKNHLRRGLLKLRQLVHTDA